MLKTSVYLIFVLSCLFFCNLSADIVYNSLCHPTQHISKAVWGSPKTLKTRVNHNTIVTNLVELKQTIFRDGKSISVARGSKHVPEHGKYKRWYGRYDMYQDLCEGKRACYFFTHTFLIQNRRRDVLIVINQDWARYRLFTRCIFRHYGGGGL